MKNIVSTIIVFGTVFILIIAGAFIFDKFNGFGLIDNVDSSLNNGIKKVLESEDDNTDDNNKFDEIKDNTVTNNYIKDNISDNTTNDNSSKNSEITTDDDISYTDNSSDNITIDNNSLLMDNESNNNIPSDNVSDRIYL